MHPFITIQRLTFLKNIDRKSKTVRVVKRIFYKIKAKNLTKYKIKQMEKAKKEFGKDCIRTMQYKQKMSRKEWEHEKKVRPKHCETKK